ncbi:MAG: hypothetical protein JGK17_00775 [Microcoleus sp. PH2017_10_PVI_O_A]|uniref:hypothetical protein n=1 Tax=unclassified Microcoleus TaxID=2642155 RepID=UPI001D3DB6A5|nr:MULTISPECIES: hypothetical protein [unclassified Microcoleus]TAE84854.1 MAG: hypothetical protein EAZ83_04565 [Oscillatoriales cyanobacterium]MCC3404152.1 hypothetical protein [Microcoleus sp. PH2017_10_PVI_O_A]MCC3458237.1 hypothetical protein [Microcoleus sp. PH2017_11_PCY_U_A]MCC3476677.1 hypothetical protein [Microcoleus sp. PH2017_12_PCY_D_A]MCC3529556.1 hypothetical protein [Microcoleus sp. PH2017_21_RUC_O_A]
MMNEPGYIPPPDVDRRLLANLRRSRLEMEELGWKLEEVIAKLDEEHRQIQQKRLQTLLNSQ